MPCLNCSAEPCTSTRQPETSLATSCSLLLFFKIYSVCTIHVLTGVEMMTLVAPLGWISLNDTTYLQSIYFKLFSASDRQHHDFGLRYVKVFQEL